MVFIFTGLQCDFKAFLSLLDCSRNPTPKNILGVHWDMTTKGEILYYLAINSTENSTTLWNYRQRECAFWTEYLPQVIGYITPTYPPTTEVCGGNFAGGKKVFFGGNEPKLFLGSRRTPFLCPSGKKDQILGLVILSPISRVLVISNLPLGPSI